MAHHKFLYLAATALISSGFGFAAAQAQDTPAAGGLTTLPPLSLERAKYYKEHPAEWAALIASIPKRPMLTAPRPAPLENAPAAGTWKPLAHLPPGGALVNPLLMTDGTVIVHGACTGAWYKLKPDATGSYVNGTWSTIASLQSGYTPLYFASQVLNDGRVVINGGEYDAPACANITDGDWSTQGAIYNPLTNTWAAVAPPSGWTTIGDAQSVILPNGKYMLANCCTKESALFNSGTLGWTATGTGKFDENDEEGWALLQNDKVLTADAYVHASTCGKGSEIYTPASGAWSASGLVTTQLSDCLAGGHLSFEVGPLVVRPNGSVVGFSGVTTGIAGTSIYNPATSTWSVGPNIPTITSQQYNLADAPAVALPSGNILFAASPGLFNTPSHFFEFSNTANTIAQVADTPDASGEPAYVINFLMLPNGQVLQTDQSNDVQIYTPAGAPNAAWRPTISACPTTITHGKTYKVSGKQMSGITHGVYGDDQQAATNFPLVRLRNKANGKVFYAKTTGFTYRGDALSKASSANFRVPPSIAAGAYTLEVVANGIASAKRNVTVN